MLGQLVFASAYDGNGMTVLKVNMLSEPYFHSPKKIPYPKTSQDSVEEGDTYTCWEFTRWISDKQLELRCDQQVQIVDIP